MMHRLKQQQPARQIKSSVNMAANHGFVLKYITGDLFTAPHTDSLVHCVAQDLFMGRGIAVEFKRRFGLVKQLHAQNKQPGEVAVLTTPSRTIFYMVTKVKSSDLPTYQTLYLCLVTLRNYCQQNDITQLAMPRIGCGIDRLQWDLVVGLIEGVFLNSAVTITVYTLPTAQY